MKAVTNGITAKPRVEPKDLKHRIEDAFNRQALVDAKRVSVQVSGGEVTLRGSVRSCTERRSAQHTARSAPGVPAVHNYITVDAA